MKAQQSLQSSLPVLPGGRLLLHVVHHSHLLLVWCKHLEASAVTAQVVHGAGDRDATYCIWTLRGLCNNRNITNTDTHYTPSWTSVPSHQPHPENTWVTMSLTDHIYIPTSLFSSSLVMTCSTYHCDIGVSPVAIIAVVNKAGGLASQKSQGLFWQQSPSGQHDLA